MKTTVTLCLVLACAGAWAAGGNVHDLSADGGAARIELKEIMGRATTVKTTCLLTREGEHIRLQVDAEDPDILNLLATVPVPGQEEGYLFEEDVLQIATAAPGATSYADFLLINPLGKRVGSKAAQAWEIETRRHSEGWQITAQIPVIEDHPCMGLSLHRFFRGSEGEIQGVDGSSHWPLNPDDFTVLILKPDLDPEQVEADFRRSTRDAIERQRQEKVDASKQWMKKHAATEDTLDALLDQARAFALEREEEGTWDYTAWEAHLHLALIDLWEVDGDRKWIELAIKFLDKKWKERCDKIDVPCSVLDVPRKTWYGHNPRYEDWANVLATGTIVEPMARLLRVVHDDPELADVWERLQPWIPLCREAIAEHGFEWVEFPDGSGFYLEPYYKGPRRVYPKGGSRIVPYNRAFVLGTAMIHLGRILDDDEYLRKVAMMARHFLNRCTVQDNGALVWEYIAGKYPTTGEDASHASVQVRFAALCAQEGIVFTDEDLRRIATTLRENVLRDGVAHGTVRGLEPDGHLARLAVCEWNALLPLAPELHPTMVTLANGVFTDAGNGIRDYGGWGIRLVAELELARRRLAAGQPDDGR